MQFEGSIGVLERLFKKKALLQAQNVHHQDYRPLLLILSGTNRGAYGSGQISALQDHGLEHVFDTAVGVSTGAPTVGYLLAKQSPLGASIYCEECTSPDFISLRRMRVNLDYIASVFREGKKELDQEAVRSARTNFFVATTCAHTGKGVLLDAKSVEPDIVHAIRASIAIPGLGGPPVDVSGKLYTDGAGALPLPIRSVIKQFNPTDIVVLANRPEKMGEGPLRDIVFRRATAKYPKEVQDAFLTMTERFEEELAHLRTVFEGRYAILWCDEDVGTFERKSEKLRAAVSRAQAHLHDLLTQAHRST